MENLLVVVIEMMLIVLAAVAFYTCSDAVKVSVQKTILYFAYRLAERTDCCLQGFGAILFLLGFIPISTGYNHSGVKHSACLRNAAIGTAYNACPDSNIHAECDAMRTGLIRIHNILKVLFFFLPKRMFDDLEAWTFAHSVLYVASARSKSRGASESFNPCSECATLAMMLGLKHLYGHNKAFQICKWSGDKCYGGVTLPQLAPRYSL